MVTLVHVASLVSIVAVSLLKDTSDREVRRNINALRNKIWFQMYWNDEQSRELIESDEQLKKLIGCMNREKLSKQRYEAWQRKKFVTMIEKKMAEA
ncbi:hypothetical protein ACF3OH_12505 [Chryseomicrobium aureum]|uniref:hypothetical protein n=1 Tax=Chryseomicrobium aureum TaxID=1441723 RepID=UPI001957EA18|nr:hypothetical protein [Chryseomicrobium aureum]MBM7705792.1 hypothetical protein [Chryseomicrobium aureum]